MTYTQEELALKFGFPINEQQVEAVNKAVHWYKGLQDRKHIRRSFRLAGFAGTGKTTVAKVIAELCCTMDRVTFIAPTGKAASRLRQKGCPNATTLHKIIYNVRGEDEEGNPIFVAKGDIDDKPLLFVLDEASMVGEYDSEKLEGHGIPVLYLGDYGQVPPVVGRQIFREDNADFTLDKIERNAGNIVRASMFVRQGKRLPLREYEDVGVREGRIPDDVLNKFIGEDGVVLCAFNSTRQELNKRCRALAGFEGMLPGVGEKLVCTFNQHGYNIMNGEQIIVEGFRDLPERDENDDEDPDLILIEFRSLSDGKHRVAKFNPKAFTSQDESEKKEIWKSVGGFDWGWALTVHKSQGSEWPFVLLLEQSLSGCPYAKLMYTGITRAVDYMLMYRNPKV